MDKDRTARKNSHAGHRERMRERFSHSGFDNYRPHEVLEQMLYYSLPRVNTNEIAHELIDRAGSLENVLLSDRDELKKTHGIGDCSADYIKSIVPCISEMIVSQYRELDGLNIYNIAFLGDWFLRFEANDRVGLVVCDDTGRFVDFRYVDTVLDECEIDPYALGDTIARRFLCERYYLIVKGDNPYVTRENMLTLRDYTLRLSSFMCDAYRMEGSRPVSFIYK